ncbi:MAG: type II CAAX endopeptidase family protein [Candidatus Aegiribacteria sp.]
MPPAEGGVFLETGVPGKARPLTRLAIAVAGVVIWGYLQALSGGFLSFIEDFIPRYALAGIPALLPVLLFWRLVPPVAGVLGAGDGRAAAASAAALFLPFAAVALRFGLEYQGISGRWFVFALSLLLLAAWEEIVCRGFLMDCLSFRKSRLTGLLLSSAVFSMMHLGNENASAAGLANIFLAGALFGLLRIVTGGLWYPVAVHWIWNLMTGMVFGWNVSGHILMPTLFSPVTPPPWGGFGPEESFLMTVGTVGGMLILLKRIYSPDDEAHPGT